MDTTTPQGVLMFNLFGSLFGSLAEYERALIAERVKAGLAAARRRGRKGGRRPCVDAEKVDQIVAALEGGASKASVCRTFKVPRSTLIDTLRRAGWTGPGKSEAAMTAA
jgi:DNA invertase Pin-like site-specific DNA recombinase